MLPADVADDLVRVLLTEQQIRERVAELCRLIEADEPPQASQGDGAAQGDSKPLLLVGVLKGAVMVMADLARELRIPIEMDWMAVSSYGTSTRSSGVVRILKDLDAELAGRRVLIVEDIVDSGLTLSWLVTNLRSRGPKSVEVCALLRKPEAIRMEVDVRYRGFDIPNEFVVGYGLDYAERYRNLRAIGVLAPHVYAA
ncbi:hypoxanthine phosphoribosyltransferase [uncultured Amnibacterium sp.]|uniref:hypoxanthine phosphoribosyltransferase n=1 Tax=uncultured Amnibacterium sp. TaxID=1631851 RepID=UPI0035CBC719